MTYERFRQILLEEGWPEESIGPAWKVRPDDPLIVANTSEDNVRHSARMTRKLLGQVFDAVFTKGTHKEDLN